MSDAATLATPLQVTAGSIDPDYHDARIEIDEWRQTPVPHRYVHGRFDGTEARFSFYFPPADQYRQRFFHNTYPMALSADIGPFPIAFEVATGDLGFTVDSGAYYVQTNNGGLFRAPGVDPGIAAYRVNAAAAKFSREVAARVYGEHRPFGYLFGGSGGAYQTMGAAQNTSGVWDGFLPFVPGCNHAIPSMFTVRMHALRVLRRRDRLAAIADALAVGGSGDPYAGLDEDEAAAFREVTRMGFPLRGWYDHAAMDSGYFANISGMIPVMDPDYAEDFWTRPGYLGSDPGSTIAADRFALDTSVVSVSDGLPRCIELAAPPGRDCADAHLAVLSGAAAGASLPIARGEGASITLIATADPVAASAIAPGDAVRIDNGWTLALQTYHRHQVPPAQEYCGWDQFRGSDGTPTYPQRDILVGPTGTANAAGSTIDGRINGKVLALAALMDIDSFPWQADWYRSRVRAAMGDAGDDSFAIYFVEHAHHENPMTPLQRAHAVSYGGALQQALRDLARWVEDDVAPRSTRYEVFDAQVVVPPGATDRMGIQPVLSLHVGGGDRAEVAVGETVTFAAEIEVPTGAGKVVRVEWDFAGSGDFAEASFGAPAERIQLSATHAFSEPGTYFVVVRAASQRDGDQRTAYGLVQNLAQVRVVVT